MPRYNGKLIKPIHTAILLESMRLNNASGPAKIIKKVPKTGSNPKKPG